MSNEFEPVALVRAAQTGDVRAQDELVSAYLPLLYNVVGRALHGHADVDDVVQETMLRALGALGSLRDPASFRSWLLAIAMNEMRRYWQTHPVEQNTGPLNEAQEIADPGADFVDLTILRLGLSGQRRETAEATRWLDSDDNALLSLWWLEVSGQLSRADVAAAMGLSAQHTAVRVQRMKAQLETARAVIRALATNPPCPGLAQVTESWDGQPSALWRKRLARHVRDCPLCSEQGAGLVVAERLLVGLALVPLSAALAAYLQMFHGSAAAAATGIPGGAGHGGAISDPLSGGPLPDPGVGGGAGSTGHHAATGGGADHGAGSALGRAGRHRRKRGTHAVTAGATVVLLLAVGGVIYSINRDSEDDSHEARTEPVKAPVSTSAAPSPTPSRSPSPSASPSRSEKPKPKPSSPKPKPTPSRTTATPQKATPKADTGGGSAIAQVTQLVNNERAKNGCGPVTANPKLQSAAQGHSDDMADRDFFSHTDPDGGDPGDRITAAGYRWSTYGENIAAGQQTPAQVMEGWMNSSGHRANILNCDFKEIGVGLRQAPSGPLWTQNFGTAL
ncbi:sigma-70 family RNA polymerase sigma factor [Streptomyces sp. NA04227]|uniref:sigma-70 family RNA polymerase sigma factor n=1 Tax=Streptomyces sp. NA04227 TaxID=2742136 RepID=UPI0015902614|nr:sigma-70 family RNA polymerase sigma factor [Streptomyces sp. NA04227]QKW10060.1 sigma-70 family RNA polymerase sigma factor [Streptomyces sp. NA04227]